MKKRTLFTAILILQTLSLYSQNDSTKTVEYPPVIFEALIGNRGFASQMVINKGFQGVKKLGFFSVTNISSKWNEDNSKDAMVQANLTYEVIKNVRVLGGMHYTPTTGLRPTAGFLYTLATKNFLININPRFIGFSRSSITEGFVMVEYKPQISRDWSIYSRLQGLYSETLENGDHARSYLMMRIGLGYKLMTFGLGANWDQYGPQKDSKQNYGIFISARLFH